MTRPAACPEVTAVGSAAGINPEKARQFSGGGFSALFARPAFQDTAVASYLDRLGPKNKGRYSENGRALPDVSAQGEYFAYQYHGTTEYVSGNIAAAAVWTAIAARFDSDLVNAGNKPLGHLNPFLYKNPSSLLDVVTGGDSFPAVTGWDAVTGLGTPSFPRLRSSIAGL